MGRRFVMRLSVEKRWLPEIVEEPSGFLSDCGIERLAGVAVPKRRTCRSRNRTELHEKYGQTFYWLFPLDKTIVFHFYDFVLVLSVVFSRCQLYSVSLSQRKLIPNSALFILPFREFYA